MKQIDIIAYLQAYPRLRKWVNECSACHTIGYKPEMPEHIGNELSWAGAIIRQTLKPMDVDEMGFCSSCSKFRK